MRHLELCHLKFGYFEKATVFEKIFHLKFDATESSQILSGRFFQILCASQNVQTLLTWDWFLISVSGAIVGSIVWWRRPQNHLNAEEYIQYKAMLISLATHLLLLMFELLVADQLESDRHYWILVFVPLVFVSLISIPICIWSVRHDRSFELELFCAVNMLQFIFIALKLDA